MADVATRLRRLPRDMQTNLSFFSRLPIATPAGNFDLRESAGAWPAAGFVIALGPALAYLLMLAAGFPVAVAALLTIAALAAVTGAMHEDGLADTADGLGGGQSREQKLATMRDSRLGAFGALALLFSVFVRTAALASITHPSYGAGAVALLLVAILSRAMALWHWNATMPARPDGFAWAAGRPDWSALLAGLIIGGLAAIVALALFGIAGLIGLLLGSVAVSWFTSICRRQIGGHTGDTIGAAQQVAEAAVLVGFSLSSAPHFF